MSDTRQRIVLAAMHLFWEKGYESTSVADVLKSAGANSGSLYHFFPGKQDLLLAVLSLYLEGIHPMLLQPAWQGIDDPIERVFALLSKYRESLAATECTYGCPIGSLALELHEPDPAVRQLLADNFNAWVSAIEQCFEDAGARLPESVDRRSLAHFVLTTMEGGVMQARTYRDVHAFDQCVEHLRTYLQMLEVATSKRKRVPAKRAVLTHSETP